MTNQLPDAVSAFDDGLGLVLDHVAADRVTATLTLSSKHHQPYGIVHGGVYCSVVESTASVGAATWFGDRGHCVGVSNTTNFLRATREGVLTVTATPITRGRTQQLWNVDITNEQGKLVATGQVRIANVTDPDALGSAPSA